jgi:hypothetical protein
MGLGGIGGAIAANEREQGTESMVNAKGKGETRKQQQQEQQQLRRKTRDTAKAAVKAAAKEKRRSKREVKKNKEESDFREFTHPHARLTTDGAAAAAGNAGAAGNGSLLLDANPHPEGSGLLFSAGDDSFKHYFPDIARVLAEFTAQVSPSASALEQQGEGGEGDSVAANRSSTDEVVDMETIKKEFLESSAASTAAAVNDDDEEEEDDEQEEEQQDDQGLPAVPADVKLVLDLLPRCGFFAAQGHPLQVRVASVALLGNAVKKLAGCSRPGVKRRLLPAIHTLWPALVPAFSPSSVTASSSSAHNANKRNNNNQAFVTGRGSSSPSSSFTSSSRRLLSQETGVKITTMTTSGGGSSPLTSWVSLGPLESALCASACDLVSSLALAAGDFLGFKFDDDLWPALQRLLKGLARPLLAEQQKHLFSSQRGTGSRTSGSGGRDRSHTRRYRRLDETRLRKALFGCLISLAELPQCRRFMVPVAGMLAKLLVPFLREQGEDEEEGDRDGDDGQEDSGARRSKGNRSNNNTNNNFKAAAAAHDDDDDDDDNRRRHTPERLCQLLFRLDGDAVWRVLWKDLSPAAAAAHTEGLATKRSLAVSNLNLDLPRRPLGAVAAATANPVSPPKAAATQRPPVQPATPAATSRDGVLVRLLCFSEHLPQARWFS